MFFLLHCFENYVSRDEFCCLHERIVYDNIDSKGTWLLCSLTQNELRQFKQYVYTWLMIELVAQLAVVVMVDVVMVVAMNVVVVVVMNVVIVVAVVVKFSDWKLKRKEVKD